MQEQKNLLTFHYCHYLSLCAITCNFTTIQHPLIISAFIDFSWYIILTELILTIFRLICYLKRLNTIVCDNGTVQFFFFFFFGVRLNIISGKSNVFIVTYVPCFSSLKLDWRMTKKRQLIQIFATFYNITLTFQFQFLFFKVASSRVNNNTLTVLISAFLSKK